MQSSSIHELWCSTILMTSIFFSHDWHSLLLSPHSFSLFTLTIPSCVSCNMYIFWHVYILVNTHLPEFMKSWLSIFSEASHLWLAVQLLGALPCHTTPLVFCHRISCFSLMHHVRVTHDYNFIVTILLLHLIPTFEPICTKLGKFIFITTLGI